MSTMLCAGCLTVSPEPVRGVLHGDVRWEGVVYIEGDVVLDTDARLTILPGTRVRFLPSANGPDDRREHPYFPGSELNVKGKLYAIGTKDMPVVFESAEPGASPGSWGAINMDGSKEAVFEYCLFRQADSAIHSRDSQVYIEHSVFEDNKVGVRFHDSNILVEHNLIRRNGAGVRFHFGSPVICNNVFQDNDINIFVTSYPRDYRIENNTFGVANEYQIVLGEQVPDDVFLHENFWMTDNVESLRSSFYDRSRSEYLGRVVIDPVRNSPSSQAGPSWSP